MNFRIIGTGCVLPRLKVSNDDLAAIVDTSDEWIVSKTGIKERRFLTDETLTDISSEAALLALENAGLSVKDVDLIICTTICGDTHTPSQACIIAHRLGCACAAYDINAACSGFIYALDAAAGYFARGKVKNVLIVSAEQMSRHLNFSDRSTCVLFGDGAAAAVLTEGDSLLSIKIASAPDEAMIRIPFTGGKSPFNKREYEKALLSMNGQEVYKFAVSSAPADIAFVLKEAGLNKDDLDYVLLHQANIRILDAVREKMGLSADKFLTCIQSTGNISSVTIPILLDMGNRSGIFKNGDILALSAFGAGLTTAACILKWTK